MRCERFSYDVLGVQGLAAALLAARDAGALAPGTAGGFVVPRDLSEIPEPEERFTRDERDRLATTLERALAPLEPHVAVLDSIRSLRAPRASVVIAGQQPGFLAAPLFNLHKALHVVRLARALAQAWERPVVPVFWNHADDHDLAEVNHAFVANQNLDLQRIGLSSLSSGRQPFSRVVLTEERHRLAAVRATLEELLRGEPHLAEALELFLPREGESLARAFTRANTALLGHLGLVVLEPDWIRPELSRALADVIGRAPLGRKPGGGGTFEDALHRGAQGVSALGHAPAIDPREAAILYRVDATGRNALRLGGEGLRYDGEQGSRTRAELAAEIVQDTSAWSPAALTRAIAQDAALPTAAYVGGLGEMAYHAQLVPLRDLAGVPRTPFVPRFSCTLVEPDVAASLDKLGLSAEHVLRARGVLDGGGGGGGASNDAAGTPPVVEAMREIASRAARELNQQRQALAELDAGLAANLKRTGDQIRSLVEKMAEKAERVHQNRAGRGQKHLRRVSNALMPRGTPQERVLGPLPLVARHGRGFVDELLECVPAIPLEHVVARFEDATTSTPRDDASSATDEGDRT